jgi:hypothetical protein
MLGLFLWIVVAGACIFAVSKITGLGVLKTDPAHELSLSARITCVSQATQIRIELQTVVTSDYPRLVDKLRSIPDSTSKQRDFDDRLLDGDPHSYSESTKSFRNAKLFVFTDIAANSEDECQPRLILSSSIAILLPIVQPVGYKSEQEIQFVRGDGTQDFSESDEIDEAIASTEPYGHVYSVPLGALKSGTLFLRFAEPLNATKGMYSISWRQMLSVETDRSGSKASITVLDSIEYPGRFDEQRPSPGATLVSPAFVPASDIRHQIASISDTFYDSVNKRPYNTRSVDPRKSAVESLYAVDSDLKEYADLILFALAAIFGAAVSGVAEILISMIRGNTK